MQRIDIPKLVSEARFNRFHLIVLLWCFVIIVADGYDLAVAGVALPAIMRQMQVEPTTAGFMASSALFGMMFGAMILGTLADKLGRRWALSIAVGLFSVFTAAAGLTSDPVTFSAMRFIAGLGIGGAVPCQTAQMAEYAPKKLRGLLITVMTCGYAIGSVIAALTAKQFLEAYGWQAVFFAAGAPVLLIPFMLKYMPESLPFLIRQQEDAQVRSIMARIAPTVRLDANVRFVMPAEDRATGAPVARLFREGRGFSTVMFWLLFFMGLFMVYALSTWLVKLLAMAGHSLGSALNFLLIFNAGAIIGAVFGGWLADRLNAKWVLCGYCAASAVSLTLLGYGTQPLWLVVALVGASTLGTQILGYSYVSQFYPTAIRSTGVGFAAGIGRAGGILAPILIGMLVAMKLPIEQNFMAIGLAGLLATVAVMLIDHGRSTSGYDVDTQKNPHAEAWIDERPAQT